jgi:hypothetical protein
MQEALKKEVPDGNIKKWAERQSTGGNDASPLSPLGGKCNEGRLMYHDMLDDIIESPIPPPSLAKIVSSSIQTILDDNVEPQLAHMKFSVEPPSDSEPLFWTCTRYRGKFWLKFSLFEDSTINATADEESQIRVTEDELVQLLLHSTIL